jgi:hypothetical protein
VCLALLVRSACLRQPLQVQRKAQSILRFVSLRVPCTIAAVNPDCTRDTQCLPPPAPSEVTKDTKYSRKICVIACPLYSQGSQRQLCKGHALTQILIIYFVSLVAPSGAEEGTADRQCKTQIMLKCVSLRVPCTIAALILGVLSCLSAVPASAPSGARKDTTYIIKMCVIVCPLNNCRCEP